MKTYNPSIFAGKVDYQMRIWTQSVHEALNSGINMGTPTGSHTALDGSVNAGVFNQFDKGNSSGVLVRISATGTNTGAPYSWPASGGLRISHGLLRQPIGFKVVDKDKTVDVFRTAPPDKDFITLQPTDTSASVTVYIF